MMKIKKILAGLMTVSLLTAILFPTHCSATAENSFPEIKESGFMLCNGVNLEYAVYGDNTDNTIILLPPNGGTLHSFDGNVLPVLAKNYRVIAISPRASGNSERGEGKLTFDVMSEDLVCFLDQFGLRQVSIFGFSDGGNLGIVFTLQHPEYVKKLAVMGANINTRGTKTFNQIGIVIKYLSLCITAYITGSEKYALERDIQGMMVGQPNLNYEDLSAIHIPFLNIYGENDMIKRSHSKAITASVDGAEEIMVIGGGHSDCFDYTDTVIGPALTEFFADND